MGVTSWARRNLRLPLSLPHGKDFQRLEQVDFDNAERLVTLHGIVIRHDQSRCFISDGSLRYRSIDHEYRSTPRSDTYPNLFLLSKMRTAVLAAPIIPTIFAPNIGLVSAEPPTKTVRRLMPCVWSCAPLRNPLGACCPLRRLDFEAFMRRQAARRNEKESCREYCK